MCLVSTPAAQARRRRRPRRSLHAIALSEGLGSLLPPGLRRCRGRAYAPHPLRRAARPLLLVVGSERCATLRGTAASATGAGAAGVAVDAVIATHHRSSLTGHRSQG